MPSRRTSLAFGDFGECAITASSSPGYRSIRAWIPSTCARNASHPSLASGAIRGARHKISSTTSPSNSSRPATCLYNAPTETCSSSPTARIVRSDTRFRAIFNAAATTADSSRGSLRTLGLPAIRRIVTNGHHGRKELRKLLPEPVHDTSRVEVFDGDTGSPPAGLGALRSLQPRPGDRHRRCIPRFGGEQPVSLERLLVARHVGDPASAQTVEIALEQVALVGAADVGIKSGDHPVGDLA